MIKKIVDGMFHDQFDARWREQKQQREAVVHHHYRIMVESAALPTHADLIANYGEGHVFPRWDESEIELHESLRKLTPPMGEVTLLLKTFGCPITAEKVIKWADEHNHRLVFPWEREAFFKANLDLRLTLDILDLGSFVLDINYRPCGRCLLGRSDMRYLGASWLDIEWCENPGFLFASK